MEEKLLARVKKTNYCWEWGGGKFSSGYGCIWNPILKKNEYVHRVSYKLFCGKIPKGLLVCHKCDNPICVKPQHLFLGTYKDNIQDAIKKGRFGTHFVKGELHMNAKLKDKAVKEIRKLYGKGRYGKGEFTQQELSKRFNVSQLAINFVVRRKTWKHI